MENTPELFRRVSNEDGHHTVPTVMAEEPDSGFRVLKQSPVDEQGRLLPFKPREDIAANGTPKPETASGDDTTEESS